MFQYCVYALYLINTLLFLIKDCQQTLSEKINNLLEQVASLEEEVAASKAAAEKLPVLSNELAVVNQSHADLEKHLEALETSHLSAVELKCTLENALAEKTNLTSTLEKEIKELTEKTSKDAESHASDVENFLEKEKILEEKLDAAKQSATAAKAEASSRREQIKTMKATLSAASRGLEERDGSIKSLKEKRNKAEAEQLKTSHLLKEKMTAMNKIKVGYRLILGYVDNLIAYSRKRTTLVLSGVVYQMGRSEDMKFREFVVVVNLLYLCRSSHEGSAGDAADGPGGQRDGQELV